MPESTCLHIQDRESGPIRVVDIPWISVRIGRASYCEVRLPEPDLAELACRLHRRGGAWNLVPVDHKSAIWLDGERVAKTCPLPFDVPFAVGPFCLTLRQDRAAQPEWHMSPPEKAPRSRWSRMKARASAQAREQPARTELIANTDRLVEAAVPVPPASAATAASHEQPRDSQLRERWETRWRTASAALMARAEHTGDLGQGKKAHEPRRDAPSFEAPRARDAEPQPPPWALAPRPDPPVSAIPVTAARLDSKAWVPRQSEAALRLGNEHSWETWIARERPAEARRPTSEPLEPEPAGTAADPEAIAASKPEPLDSPPADAPPAQLGDTAAPARIEVDRALLEDEDAASASRSRLEPPVEASRTGARVFAGSIRQTVAEIARDDRSSDASFSAHASPSVAITIEPQEARLPAVKNAEWPSAKDILASHQAARRAQPAPKPRRVHSLQALPTVACEPGQFMLPATLAGPPAVIVFCVLGLAGCFLSCRWAADSCSAAIVTDRLVAGDRIAERRPLPEGVAPPQGSWTYSTAQHLAHWAMFLCRNDSGNEAMRRTATSLWERAPRSLARQSHGAFGPGAA